METRESLHGREKERVKSRKNTKKFIEKKEFAVFMLRGIISISFIRLKALAKGQFEVPA